MRYALLFSMAALLGCMSDPETLHPPAVVSPPDTGILLPSQIKDPPDFVGRNWYAATPEGACPAIQPGIGYGSFAPLRPGTEMEYSAYFRSRYFGPSRNLSGEGGAECAIGELNDSVVSSRITIRVESVKEWGTDSLLVSLAFRSDAIISSYRRGRCRVSRFSDTTFEEFPWDYIVAKGGLARWNETLGRLGFSAQAIDADTVDLAGLAQRDAWDTANAAVAWDAGFAHTGFLFRHSLQMRKLDGGCIPELWKGSVVNAHNGMDIRFAYRAGIGLVRVWLKPDEPASVGRRTYNEINLVRLRVPGEPERVFTP